MSGDRYENYGYAPYYSLHSGSSTQRSNRRGSPAGHPQPASTAAYSGYFVPASVGVAQRQPRRAPQQPMHGYHRPRSSGPQPGQKGPSMQQHSVNLVSPIYSAPSRQMERFGAVVEPESAPHRTSPQIPLTVNPSHITNRSEYPNRNQPTEAQFAPAGPTAPSPVTSPPSLPAKHARSDSGSREQLQAEMRAMIAKMQDYKSKDPILFIEAWEQLKRDMPPRTIGKQPDVFPETTPQTTFTAVNSGPSEGAHSTSKLPDLGKLPAPHCQRSSDAGITGDQKVAQNAMENRDRIIKGAPVSTTEPRPPEPTTSATSSVNEPRSKGTTIWPEAKKILLAQAAINLLSSYPINNEKNVTQAEILDWLQSNLDYDELCRKFHAKGFQFDKRVFARHLLAAMSPASDSVPDTTPPPAAHITSSGQSPNVGMKRKRGPSTDANQGKRDFASVAGNQPHYDGRSIPSPASHGAFDTSKSNPLLATKMETSANRPLTVVAPASVTSNPNISSRSTVPEVPPMMKTIPPILTKEAMAKKSDFNDLMDLTQLPDSDEEAEPGNKVMKTALPDPRHLPNRPVPPKSTLYQQQTRPPGEPTLSAAQLTAIAKMKSEALAQPLIEAKAARKSSYNPATIARDFLIAKGDHPDERPLNFHLDVLRINLPKNVGRKTDLSTVRWDLIDPVDDRQLKSAPTVQGSKASQETHGQSGATISKEAPTAQQPLVAPPGTSHSPAKIPTPTRDPAISKPSTSITSQTFVAVDDGTGPALGPSPARKASTPIPTQERKDTGTSLGGKAVGPVTPSRLATKMVTPSSSGAQRGRPPQVVSAAVQGRLAGFARDSSADTASRGKRRGRPPGSKNRPSGRKPGRAPKAKAPVVNTTMPEDGIGVVISSSPPSTGPIEVSYVEPRKAPPEAKKKAAGQAQSTQPDQQPDSDAYVNFKCRWIGCKASLHNLDTLHRHLVKVHKDKCWDDKTKAYSCFWGDCEEFDAFQDTKTWEQHIREVHLDHLARELGDGPTTHPAALDLSYLMDDKGRFVVPIARTEGTPDPLPLWAGRGPTRAYHKAHGNNTPEARKRAEQQSLKYHATCAAKARQGELSSNKTAEWRTDWDGPSGRESNTVSGSEVEDSEDIDVNDVMQE